MPWWSWLLIWSGLVIALLAMLTLFAVSLFRKGVALAEELATTAATLELLDRASDVAAEQHTELAILQTRSEVRARREQVRARSAERKARNHDARLDRARRITRVDASARKWFS
jgi:hypothetical protein